MKILNKKGFSGQVMVLASSAMALVVAGLVLSYGSKVSSDVSGELEANSTSKSAVDNVSEGIGRLAKQTPLVGTVLAAVVIITILLAGFGGFLTGRRR